MGTPFIEFLDVKGVKFTIHVSQIFYLASCRDASTDAGPTGNVTVWVGQVAPKPIELCNSDTYDVVKMLIAQAYSSLK